VAPASDSPSGSPIRKRLLDQIPDEVPDRESAAIAAFAQAYVRRLPDEEMPSIPAEELFAEILAQDGARLPGDRRLKLREAAARDGVNIPDDLLDDIKARAS